MTGPKYVSYIRPLFQDQGNRLPAPVAKAEANRLSGPRSQSAFFFSFFLLFRAPPEAYGSSQARGRIGDTAASLRHRHSNARSKPHLQPTPQLIATPDPLTH